jgi:hypothetical protein
MLSLRLSMESYCAGPSNLPSAGFRWSFSARSGLLLGCRDRQPPAPFPAPALEHDAARPRPHALAESVRALAALAMRLKGSFHGQASRKVTD